LARVRAEGCEEAQGFLISRPRPVAEVLGLLGRYPKAVAAA
jgi:EAL domain-containing protein (putative c-di-GMP-specific phosphodiesterase class I)